MTKAIIYQDDLSEVVFCVNGNIYFKNNMAGTYIEARDILKSLRFIRTKAVNDRKELINKFLSMKYKEAAKFHLENQKSKGRNGKIFEGEFNDK